MPPVTNVYLSNGTAINNYVQWNTTTTTTVTFDTSGWNSAGTGWVPSDTWYIEGTFEGNIFGGTYVGNWAPFTEETEKEKKRRARANAKAKKLLNEFLTLPQRKEYKDKGYFHIESELGKTYRIHKARSHNVKLIEESKIKMSLCAHPIEGVPDEDTMLAQALMLMTQEKAFLKIANKSAA